MCLQKTSAAHKNVFKLLVCFFYALTTLRTNPTAKGVERYTRESREKKENVKRYKRDLSANGNIGKKNFCEAQASMLLQVRNIFWPKNVIILLFSGSKCTSVNTSSSCPDWVRVDGTDNNIFDGIYCKTSQLVHGSPVYKGPCSKNVCMALSR